MLFNSFSFLIFLPVFIILYFLSPVRWRWALLLAASYFFYAYWKLEYLVLIIFSTVLDFVVAQQMHRAEKQSLRRFYLFVSCFANLGLLFVFKYFNFFTGELNELFAQNDASFKIPYHELLLPVGISFYTFQTLSYTIDIYYKRIVPERHLGYFALYVSFWPQLVAGPIERSSRLLPQLKQTAKISKFNFRSGFTRILWGFYKKVVIADGVSEVVETIFTSIEQQNTLTLLIGAVLFAIQIYCDFSGYSDIAIGSARLIGIDLMENFKLPYFAKSLREFWKRWHISLSTWFRDYLYIPLGGKYVGQGRLMFNLLLTFLISGLWHGANWTYIVWGAIHGMVLISEKKFGDFGIKINNRIIRLVLTQSVVLIAWIFFRAETVSDAFAYVAGIFSFNIFPLSINMLFGMITLLVWTLTIGLLFYTEIRYMKYGNIETYLDHKSPIVRYAYYTFMPCLILWFGTFSENEFIYFQF